MRRACLPFALLAACASPPPAQPPPPTPAPTPEPAVVAPPKPTLAAGVIAEDGQVRVEERDGLRSLKIGDVVQGAVPIGDAPLAHDPLVALLRAARPGAKKALVIGLGTGRTAAELASHGLAVDALEQSPVVLKFARRYFNYTGNAEVGDGLAHAKGRASEWDIILVDTLADGPPQLLADLLSSLAITDADRVLLGVRLRGAPNDPLFLAAARRTRYLQLWGAGVGDETQTLYALVSPRPQAIVAPADIHAWPLPIHQEPHERPSVTAAAVPTARSVTVLGYLIRAQEDGALSLDLPHHEMGALRYRLHGPALVQLEPLLPAKFTAMTDGDIKLDGDTSTTLREVLGGGGLKRSDVRFSPVIVALTGTARVAAVVDPDAAPTVPKELRGDVASDPRLPYGGVLYDLDVETVVWTLARPAWQKLRPQLTALARKAAGALERGEFTPAADAVDAYLRAIDGPFSQFAPRFAIHADMQRIHDALYPAAQKLPARSLPVVRGQLCADLFDRGVFTGSVDSPDIALLATAAEKCKKRLGAK